MYKITEVTHINKGYASKAMMAVCKYGTTNKPRQSRLS